jgi:hypothetical protein
MGELYSKTYSDVEILALSQIPAPKVAVTIKSGEVVAKGAVIAQVTATGLYVEYDDAGEDGSEEPAGILSMDVNASATGEDRNVDTSMFIGGAFYESKLNNGDAISTAVKTALNARSVPGRDLFIF